MPPEQHQCSTDAAGGGRRAGPGPHQAPRGHHPPRHPRRSPRAGRQPPPLTISSCTDGTGHCTDSTRCAGTKPGTDCESGQTARRHLSGSLRSSCCSVATRTLILVTPLEGQTAGRTYCARRMASVEFIGLREMLPGICQEHPGGAALLLSDLLTGSVGRTRREATSWRAGAAVHSGPSGGGELLPSMSTSQRRSIGLGLRHRQPAERQTSSAWHAPVAISRLCASAQN
jgi:hypothetical protein